MKSIQEMSKELVEQMFKEDYYLGTLRREMSKRDFSIETLDSKTYNELHSFWNGVWWRLPDSAAIRRHPFQLLCSICEGEFE